MLYDPTRFEPLRESPWNEAWVRAAIADIVADADSAFHPAGLWPADEWDAWSSPTPLKTIYVGAAGVAWALWVLRARGVADSRLDLESVARAALDAWRREPGVLTTLERPEPANASLLMGEAGILIALFEIAPREVIADDLFTLVEANRQNEAREIMWGAPGSLLAAYAMHTWTGEERWARAWTDTAEALWVARDSDGLWTQRVYGETARSLGPPHGLVGNVQALLQGDLGDDRRAALIAGAIGALARSAVWEGELVSWPTVEGRELVSQEGEARLQWCAGAPGIVISAAGYLPEELLLPAAELTWQAGPHALDKGPGICHGTAGNGYALLKTFERTGDERWLERARRFAVHALGQVERLRVARGRGRYSLWTGDVGVAGYAADCLDASARYPILDGL